MRCLEFWGGSLFDFGIVGNRRPTGYTVNAN